MRTNIKRAVMVAPLATAITLGGVLPASFAAPTEPGTVFTLATDRTQTQGYIDAPIQIDVNKDGVADAEAVLLPAMFEDGEVNRGALLTYVDRNMDGDYDLSFAIIGGGIDVDGSGYADLDINNVKVDTDGDGTAETDATVEADGLDINGDGIVEVEAHEYGIDVDGDGVVDPDARFVKSGLDLDKDGKIDLNLGLLAFDDDNDGWLDADLSSVKVDTDGDGLVDATATFLPTGGVDLDGDGVADELDGPVKIDVTFDGKVDAEDKNVSITSTGYDLDGNGDADFGVGLAGAAFTLPTTTFAAETVDFAAIVASAPESPVVEEPDLETPVETPPTTPAPSPEPTTPVTPAPTTPTTPKPPTPEPTPAPVTDAEEEQLFEECELWTTDETGKVNYTKETREYDGTSALCEEEQAVIDEIDAKNAEIDKQNAEAIEAYNDALETESADTNVITAASDVTPIEDEVVATGQVDSLADTGMATNLALFAGFLAVAGAGSLLTSRKAVRVRA